MIREASLLEVITYFKSVSNKYLPIEFTVYKSSTGEPVTLKRDCGFS